MTTTVKTISSVSVATATTQTILSVSVTAMACFHPTLFNVNDVSLQIFAIQFADCGLAFIRNWHFHKPKSI